MAKEFRYLRIVKVTTAVYEGLEPEPKPQPITYSHRASVSFFTSSYDLAETCVFSKQSPRPMSCYRPRSLPPEEQLVGVGPLSTEDTGSFCRVP